MGQQAVKFAVIGLGRGRGHCKAVQATAGAELVAVADLSEERGKAASQEYGVPWYRDYKEMLRRDDLDVAVVCVPSGLHGEVGIECARAGKHVLCEKPLEITVEKCRAIVDACRGAGVRLGVGFQNRFNPAVRRVKKVIDEGRLGRLLIGEARLKWYRTQEYYDQGGWRGTWRLDGGGALMNQAVHSIDLLQWFAGRVRTVLGHWATLNHRIETEDTGMGILRFENGAVGTIFATTCSNPNLGTEIALHGTDGTIILRDGKVATAALKGVEDAAAYIESIPLSGPNDLIQDMVEAVRTGRDPWITGEDASHSVEIVTGIYESANAGRPFDLRTRRPVETMAERRTG